MAPHASITHSLIRTEHTYSLTQSEERELGGTKYTRNTSKPYVAAISQASPVVWKWKNSTLFKPIKGSPFQFTSATAANYTCSSLLYYISSSSFFMPPTIPSFNCCIHRLFDLLFTAQLRFIHFFFPSRHIFSSKDSRLKQLSAFICIEHKLRRKKRVLRRHVGQRNRWSSGATSDALAMCNVHASG